MNRFVQRFPAGSTALRAATERLLPVTQWREMTVAEIASPHDHALATGPFGSAISSKHFRDSGVPVLRGSNLSLDVGVRLRDEGLAFLDAEKAATFQRSVARRGDLIFTCWGTVGQVGLVDERARFDQYIVSNKQMKLTPDPEKADSLFLYYLMSGPDAVAQVQGQAIGAAVPGFNLGQLREIRLRLPPVVAQRKIAAALSTYDNLIENNTRRIEVLEEMAQAIYREWFVEFRYPGHEAVRLVDSDLGPIPEGWRAAPLFEVADPTFGFAFASKQFNAEGVGTPVIRIRDLPKNRTETSTTEVAVSQYEVNDGDVLIGMDGIFHMCRWSAGRAYLNQRVVRFRPADDRLTRYQLYLGLKRPIRELNDSIVGTTVAHLGKRHLQRLHLPVPVEPLRSQTREVFDPLFDLVVALRKSTAALQASRDLLLPRLVSGEIDVSRLNVDRDGLVA